MTREDWVNAALETFISDGIEQVKVMVLAERMGVSRSSFYWYFKDRKDLLDVLLEHWLNTNTKAIIDASREKAETITGAIANVFVCFIDAGLFNTKLDFAVRDWARRDPQVRKVLDTSDHKRIEALSAMFARFEYPEAECLARARVMYYTQIGYNDADLHEPMERRIELVKEYLLTYSGKVADPAEVEKLRQRSLHIERQNQS